MKTIRETIDKWNEMYELVVGGCTSTENDTWRKMQQVFEIPDDKMHEAYDLRRRFVEECNELSEDDSNNDKDVPLYLGLIKDLLSLSAQNEYAFYSYRGKVGVLFELDDEIIRANGYESCNGYAFVPALDMDEVLKPYLDDIPNLTLDDNYGVYCGCFPIDVWEVVNPENKQDLIEDWVSDCHGESDMFVRELLTTTDDDYDWRSERSSAVGSIVQILEKFDDKLCYYNGADNNELDEDDIKDRDEKMEALRECIEQEKEFWQETCSKYKDPLGYGYHEQNSIDFENVYKEALQDYEPNDLVAKAAWQAIEVCDTFMYKGERVVFFRDDRDAEKLNLNVIDTDSCGHAAVSYDEVKKLPKENWFDLTWWPQCLRKEDEPEIIIANVSLQDASTDEKCEQFCSRKFYEFEVAWDNGEIV